MRRLVGSLVAVLCAWACGSAVAAAPSSAPDLYQGVVSARQLPLVTQGGYDVASIRPAVGGAQVQVVLSAGELRTLQSHGVQLTPVRDRQGHTQIQRAAAQAAGGYNVWRSWDEPGGIRDEIHQIAAAHPDIVKLEVLGTTYQGREILALKVSADANSEADGTKPSVLYFSAQHAREWISVEVNRRLLHYIVDGYGHRSASTRLVDTRELWFVLVANPDGYQYTFDHARLWRKNLRDNNGDGQIAVGDGVDPNRNYPERFGWDEEGASQQTSSDTYRGPAPASEPETQALKGLMDRLHPTFFLNYHSYGPLILWPSGFQETTETPDNALFEALGGTDHNPAVPGFDPGLSADLYIVNGDVDEYAYVADGILPYTVELEEGAPGAGFVFPDDENLVQAEFKKNLRFALDLARSASHPGTPDSHLGNATKPFYPHAFAVSYGDPQTVEVRARRGLDDVALHYRIGDGPEQTAPTTEWDGGERYGFPGVVYHTLRGQVTGTSPGDAVTVWFTARRGTVSSEPFTYRAEVESTARVLVMSAEDYTGISPVYADPTGPKYLHQYLDALAADGIAADVYDVDAHQRTAPDALGVLRHYDAVVWYTGDDIITREPGMVPGTASRLAEDEMLQVRDYLNEGGHLLYTGKYAGYQYSNVYEYDPASNAPCDPASAADFCHLLLDDFRQYWLGAAIYNDDAGTSPDGSPFDVIGLDTPFAGLSWSFGHPSARNQDHTASFLTTSALLPPDRYPQFQSWPAANYDRPGGPFVPHTGSQYAYSQIEDQSYKRFVHTVDLTGQTSGSLSFWTSYRTEQDWDYLVVEAHTVGQDDWTTLPDQNGHTTTDPGQSCAAGWVDIHPFTAHYQTYDRAAGSCTATGSTGSWNAATGDSGGWQEWNVDLSAYAGKQVELSISYISDWSTQDLGVFLDDVTLSTGESTSFEDGSGGWAVGAVPEGSAPFTTNWIVTDASGFKEGAAVATPQTVYLGFGIEGVAGAEARAAILGNALDYLLAPG